MEKRMLKHGDIIIVYPKEMKFYEVIELEQQFMPDFFTTGADYLLQVYFDNFSADEYSALEDKFANMPLKMKYLGEGKVQELSTSKVFPIYESSVIGLEVSKAEPLASIAPSGEIEVNMTFSEFLTSAENFVNESANLLSVHLETESRDYFSYNEAEYNKYSDEQRVEFINLVEKLARKTAEEDAERINNIPFTLLKAAIQSARLFTRDKKGSETAERFLLELYNQFKENYSKMSPEYRDSMEKQGKVVLDDNFGRAK